MKLEEVTFLLVSRLPHTQKDKSPKDKKDDDQFSNIVSMEYTVATILLRSNFRSTGFYRQDMVSVPNKIDLLTFCTCLELKNQIGLIQGWPRVAFSRLLITHRGIIV